MGTAVAGVHARHGVDVRCGVQVAGIEAANGRVRAVALADGSELPADVVLVGIGVAPAVDWLAGSGVELRDGVVCDSGLWTGLPGVFAAGDCARWTNLLFGDGGEEGAGEEMRVEHWTNAAEQGAAAANNLLAVAAGEAPTPYAPVPFFWSDQFDSRIQFLGRPAGMPDEQVEVVAGDLDGRFCALYGHRGRLRAVLGVTMPKMVMPLRKLLLERASWKDGLAEAEARRPT
jgi:NADPH-dependent 2,4-dienoyl-CoA reductase/sulfur reductase-like enzyme